MVCCWVRTCSACMGMQAQRTLARTRRVRRSASALAPIRLAWSTAACGREATCGSLHQRHSQAGVWPNTFTARTVHHAVCEMRTRLATRPSNGGWPSCVRAMGPGAKRTEAGFLTACPAGPRASGTDNNNNNCCDAVEGLSFHQQRWSPTMRGSFCLQPLPPSMIASVRPYAQGALFCYASVRSLPGSAGGKRGKTLAWPSSAPLRRSQINAS